MRAPVVFKTIVKDHSGNVEKVNLHICYHNREEHYELVSKTPYKEIDKEQDQLEGTYNQYDSIELCKGSGGRQIHYKTEEE